MKNRIFKKVLKKELGFFKKEYYKIKRKKRKEFIKERVKEERKKYKSYITFMPQFGFSVYNNSYLIVNNAIA